LIGFIQIGWEDLAISAHDITDRDMAHTSS